MKLWRIIRVAILVQKPNCAQDTPDIPAEIRLLYHWRPLSACRENGPHDLTNVYTAVSLDDGSSQNSSKTVFQVDKTWISDETIRCRVQNLVEAGILSDVVDRISGYIQSPVRQLEPTPVRLERWDVDM